MRGGSHGDRLEAFYRDQAGAYDDFRKRLLHGREEMMRGLDMPDGGRCSTWAAAPAATSNTSATACRDCSSVAHRRSVSVAAADRRASASSGTAGRTSAPSWPTRRPIEPDDGPVDAVTFSYSLTMIPNWFQAMDQA